MKYYLDKYCLTLLLQSNKLCQTNMTMAKLKKELCTNQEKDAALLAPNLGRI